MLRVPPRRRGQGLAEYGLILGLIAVVCLATLGDTGNSVAGIFDGVNSAIAAENCTLDCTSGGTCSLGCACIPNMHCHFGCGT